MPIQCKTHVIIHSGNRNKKKSLSVILLLSLHPDVTLANDQRLALRIVGQQYTSVRLSGSCCFFFLHFHMQTELSGPWGVQKTTKKINFIWSIYRWQKRILCGSDYPDTHDFWVPYPYEYYDNTKEEEGVRNQGANFLGVCTISSCLSRVLTPSDFSF